MKWKTTINPFLLKIKKKLTSLRKEYSVAPSKTINYLTRLDDHVE